MLLGDLSRARFCFRFHARLVRFTLYALALALDLRSKALEWRCRGFLGRLRVAIFLLRTTSEAFLLLAFTASTLGVALCALFLHCRTTSRSFFGLLSLFFRLLFSQLLGFFFLKLTCTLLDLGLKILANLLHISILQNAGVALSGYLHIRKAGQEFFTGHIELFSQFVYTHTSHVVSSSVS